MPKFLNNTPHHGMSAQAKETLKRTTPRRPHYIPHHNRDEAKFKMALAGVQAGLNPTKAMREAGYSVATARQSSGKYPVKKLLVKARDNYLMQYIKSIKKLKLDGASTAQRLSQVVHGKDDHNAVLAIKAHVMILLKNAPTGDSNTAFTGIFVVPDSMRSDSWEQAGSLLKQINVSDQIVEGEVVEKDDDAITVP